MSATTKRKPKSRRIKFDGEMAAINAASDYAASQRALPEDGQSSRRGFEFYARLTIEALGLDAAIEEFAKASRNIGHPDSPEAITRIRELGQEIATAGRKGGKYG